MADREVVIVDGMRTAFGRMGGALRDFIPSRLAGLALKGLLRKTGVQEKTRVDCVFMGAALHCAHALNPARWATLDAGLGHETPASFIEMQCGSAIDAVNHAAWKILAGQAEVIIAGGMESYSQAFAKFSMASPPYSLTPPKAIPRELSPVPEENLGMGEAAEILAEMYGVTRREADEFAYHSQMRAKRALEEGKLDGEITPVTIPAGRKTPEIVVDRDEQPRPETTLEGLARLRPAFRKDGVVTAGNASGRNDGAACVLLMSAAKARELGYRPYARWLAGGEAGVDPRIMGIAPAHAIPRALQRAGLSMADLDLIECNEAFALQNLAVIRELQKQTGATVDLEAWNPLGGAIAWGHPNGASGARICMFAMKELARRGGRYAVFSSCCGGGLGVASVIENLRV